jgi:Tfp pilus assembly protein PilF
VQPGAGLALAFNHHRGGRCRAAEDACRHVLFVQPDNADALHLLAILLHQTGRASEAVPLLRRAVSVRPAVPDYHNSLGIVLASGGQYEEAVACFQRATHLEPRHAEGYNNLGGVYEKMDRPGDAVAACQRAIQLKPDYAAAFNNLGVALQAQGRLQEAVDAFRRATVLAPEYAEAHVNLGMALLLSGDFKSGWREYEWRAAVHPPGKPFTSAAWDGSDPRGRTLLVHCEQGLGDTIQFSRYVPVLAGRGARVIVQCQPQLVRLMKSLSGAEAVVGQGSPLPPFDIHAPLMSLPGIVGTTASTVPAGAPYLRPDDSLVRQWRKCLGVGGYRIGIAWKGGARYRGAERRHVPPHLFGTLARVPGVRLISLQKEGSAADVAAAGASSLEQFEASALADAAFMDTAAVMTCLDLVITVDTSVAHLAGALGVATWIALPFAPDWRWMLGREDSPWYPTARLFRQERPGHWEGVFERVAGELRRKVPREVIHRSSRV